MKSALRFLLTFIAFTTATLALQAQQEDHRISAQERADMPAYLQSIARTGTNTPPPTPVRASAEWEEIDALMITWTSYTSILKEIVRYARLETEVQIICTDSNAVKTYLTNNGVPLSNVKCVVAPYNSVWCRDYGQWNVYSSDVDSLSLVDWIYNRPRPKDDTVPSSMMRYNGLPMYETTSAPYNLINTGGNFMCDGFGTGFSSNLVVDENPNISTAQIDTTMKHFMGIDRYVRFPTLPYDDIHHIDMHMKLLDEETLLVGEYPQGVSDGPQIEANLQYILANYNSVYGTPYKVIRIPMPPDGQGRYPNQGGDYRTYTNAVFVNKTVIVPSYQQQYDTTALRIWQQALPGYSIRMINCNSMITALGALHCITKEISARDPLLISHQPLADTYNATTPYQVDARIQHRSGISTADLYYRTDTTQPYLSVTMTLTNALTHTWTGYIPTQAAGSKVYYYVAATAVSGKSQVRPMPAPAGYWRFDVLTFVGADEAMANAGVQMRSAFPNPTNGLTCVPVWLPADAQTKLTLHDALGRQVATVHEGILNAGESRLFFDANSLAGGVYMLVLQTDGAIASQRLVIQ